MSAADFWTNQEQAQATVAELKALNGVLKPLDEALRADAELATLVEMAQEDDSFVPELRALLERTEKEVDDLEIKSLLSGPHDANPAILTINARDGGTDANDWAEMLLRMYIHWAQKQGYSVEILDRQDNEVAGIKSAAIAVRGPMAYGYLKGETGMHRLVRISPFNAEGKRQTSFAAVDVSPEVDDDGRNRAARRGHPRGRVPRQRRRRPARQQDLQRHPADALSHRHRRAMPERAEPAQESGDRDQDAPRPAGSDGRRKTRGRAGRQVQEPGQDRLRLADSQLLPASRSARQRPRAPGITSAVFKACWTATSRAFWTPTSNGASARPRPLEFRLQAVPRRLKPELLPRTATMNSIVLAASDELRAVFDYRDDRWGHRIEVRREDQWVAAFSSIEGDSSDDWPPSPAFQHIHLQTFSLSGPTALLVGKAGASHWSAAIEADRETSVLRFDIACRLNGKAGLLGSRYEVLGELSESAPRLQIEVPTINDAFRRVLNETRRDMSIHIIGDSLIEPRTIRWKYVASLPREGSFAVDRPDRWI